MSQTQQPPSELRKSKDENHHMDPLEAAMHKRFNSTQIW